MKHVYIFGWFWHDDLKYLQSEFHDTIKIWSGPSLSHYITRMDELHQQLINAAGCDLVIFSGFGVDLERHLQPVLDDPTLSGYFQSIPNKVYWSLDNHHAFNIESGYASFFNAVYLAHRTYGTLVHADVKYDLPCCFWSSSYDDLIRRLHTPKPLTQDVFFKHHSYSWGDRDSLLRVILQTLSDNHLTFDVVPCTDRNEYCDALRSSRVVLNLSLLCDLNFRNFEAWAFGRPLLTNELGWHSTVARDALNNTFFFRRDLTDFEPALHAALAVDRNPSKESINAVLSGHMLTHRMLQIINTELSTEHVVQFPPFR